MKNEVLQQVQNDPAYSQIMQLYSGLFDTQEEREDFIFNLLETDILLATDCKTSSVEEEKEISNNIFSKCNSILQEHTNSSYYLKALLVLLKLEKIDVITDFLTRVKGRDIQIIRQMISQIPISQSYSEFLIVTLLSNPPYFISDFLKVSELYEKELFFFNKNDINRIFSELIKNKDVKINYVLFFLKKNKDSIIISKYKDISNKRLVEFKNVQNLIHWINIFKLKVDYVCLIDEHLNIGEINNIYMAISLFDYITEKKKVDILNRMYKDVDIKIKIVFYMYIQKNYKYKLLFRDFKDYRFKVRNNCFDSYEIFYKKNFINIYSIAQTEIYISTLEVGSFIKLNYVSKRHKYYTFRNKDFISASYSHLLPFDEVPSETLGKFRERKPVTLRIIYVDYIRKNIYLSLTQLESNLVTFNKNYISEVNIGEVVDCRVKQRHPNKIVVHIYGTSKTQYSVIYADKEDFDGITKFRATVTKIKDNVIILQPIDLRKLVKITEVRTNYTSLTELRESKMTLLEKLYIYLFERISINTIVSLNSFNSHIGIIFNQKLSELFPNKNWLIYLLEEYNFIEEVEVGKYKCLKNIRSDFTKLIKDRFKEEGYSSNLFEPTQLQ